MVNESVVTSFGKYRQTSNINHTFVRNKIVDHWELAGASSAADPTTS